MTSRVLLGIIIVGGIVWAATAAVNDCTVGLYRSESCLSLWVREQTGLPLSKLGRAVVLEIAGILLAVGLYLTIFYVFPAWKVSRRLANEESGDSPPTSEPPERPGHTP